MFSFPMPTTTTIHGFQIPFLLDTTGEWISLLMKPQYAHVIETPKHGQERIHGTSNPNKSIASSTSIDESAHTARYHSTPTIHAWKVEDTFPGNYRPNH